MRIKPSDALRRLDPTFVFGVATSSFQIEGAADLRLPGIWDEFCKRPGKIRDGSNGNVACEHVMRWRDDVELLSYLGVDAYRFSISWPRVAGVDGKLNRRGLDFYRRLIDALNERDIKPFVTLYHWDLPQHLQDDGGWLNRDTAWRFCDYVRLVTEHLDGRIHSYATLNEPYCSAYLGYETGLHAPGLTDRRFGKQAAHHLLLAHGLAMRVLEETSPHTLNGIVLNFTPCYPATGRPEDRAAAASADERINRWYLEPLLEGRYPPLLDRCPADERPDIAEGDMALIAHPIDFLGVNYYTRAVYRADGAGGPVEMPPGKPVTDMGWEVYPQGLTELLISLNERYRLPPVYVAENGAAVSDTIADGEVRDHERVNYLQQHLDAMAEAIRHGVAISGFFYWSLMDNFEWAEGYAKRFGLVYVDFETQQRIIKLSGHCYRDFLLERRSRIEGSAAESPAETGPD